MQAYFNVFFSTDYFEADVDRSTRLHFNVIKERKLHIFDVSNVIYHKFSHGVVSFTLNGEKVNVMLEFQLVTV